MDRSPTLFVLAAEPSGDAHGARLIEALLKIEPKIKIGAVAGPKMRALPIECLGKMEDLQVMGFIDVFCALPRIIKRFYAIRKTILTLNPTAVICIDYPGFHLRLEKSLRRKGYQGKLIHYICPSVWAWGKKRIPSMAKNLDLLLSIFPFEKEAFAKTNLAVEYIGHPLIEAIETHKPHPDFRKAYQLSGKILALFPGSRKDEIERNFPIQLKAAKELVARDPSLQVAISVCSNEREAQVWSMAGLKAVCIPPEHTYDLMRHSHIALAKSGTVTLELALHEVPTVVHYAIKPLDLFFVQKIFKIYLPHYCIVNIIASKRIFPELYGPLFTLENVVKEAQSLLAHSQDCIKGCKEVKKILGTKPANEIGARRIGALLNS